MLSGKLNTEKKYDYTNERFQKAFAFLKNTDLTALPVGISAIDGEEVYASVQIYTTLPPQEALFESHLAYYDIQYVVEGEEIFGFASVEECNPSGEYNAEKDILFYQEPEQSGFVVLKAGDYIVVSPEEAHAPRRQSSFGPCQVKKIVVKVKV